MHDDPLPHAADRRAAAEALAACRDARRRLAHVLEELHAADRVARRRWAGLGARRFAAEADGAVRELTATVGTLDALARRIEQGLTAAELTARRRAEERAAERATAAVRP